MIARALVEAPTEGLGEVVRIAEAAGGGDLLDGQSLVGEQARGELHPLLNHVFRGAETDRGREDAGEMGAAETRDRCEVIDRERLVEMRMDIALQPREIELAF